MGAAMTFKVGCICGLAILWSSCSRNAQPPPSAGIIQPDQGGAAGYRHGIDHSKFSVGAGQRYVTEFGLQKVVGSDGVFAVDSANGLALAIPNAHSARAQRTAWFSQSPERHNQIVTDYFIGAGIPKDQVARAHATTSLAANAAGNQVPAPQPGVGGYQSILDRKIGDIPVIDSVAWARFDDQGTVLAEWVYWPAIPGRAIDDASRMRQMLASDQAMKSYVSRLPAGLPAGTIVIRHSSATTAGPFIAVASYDVPERRTAPQPNPQAGPATARGVIIMRHFGIDGAEFRLPQEQRSNRVDYPTAQRTPPAGPPR
jgi:hypothetical protein